MSKDMKKTILNKKIFLSVIMAAAIAALTCGCSSSADEAIVPTAEPIETTTSTDESASKGDENTDSGTEATENTEEALDMEEACMSAYKSFIDGDEKAYFEAFGSGYQIEAPAWEYEEMYDALPSDGAYTMKEIAECLSKGTAESYMLEDVTLEPTIAYDYIDCGDDGIPELAVLYGNLEPDDNYILVVKLIDDKLECIFQQRYGYRSYATINEYGYCNYGGSNGATSHSDTYYSIDASGQTHFLYGIDDEYSTFSFYIPDNEEYQTVADEEGITDKIEVLEYFFRQYDESEDYGEYLKDAAYIFYPLADSGDRLSGDELTEARNSDPYVRFWESTGLKSYDEDGIDELVNAVLDKYGVTEKIVCGKTVEF